MTATQPWLAHYDRHVPASLIYPEAPIHSLLEGAVKRHAERPAHLPIAEDAPVVRSRVLCGREKR